MSNITNSLSLTQFYPENLNIESVRVDEDIIEIAMHSTTKTCTCPKCMVETSVLHATHHRRGRIYQFTEKE